MQLAGYQSATAELSQADKAQIGRLEDLDWQALPLIMRSQWCQIRLRGSRKIPPQEAVEFATDGFLAQLRQLMVSCPSFFVVGGRKSSLHFVFNYDLPGQGQGQTVK